MFFFAISQVIRGYSKFYRYFCPSKVNKKKIMIENIIGRKKELELLDKYYNSGKAEFIALYGRRRVGKTFLIRQRFHNEFTFDMTGVMEGTKAEQMTAFHAALKESGYKGKKNTTWLDAFFALRDLLEKKIEPGKRCLLFIDELPCLDTPKAGFVKALGHFWNSWANWQSEIMLIVCGSATSWMVRNVIDNHGGLHDRITNEMPLHPFTLSEAEEFFKVNGFPWERLSVLQAYMAIGGVPYYMSMFEKTESPAIGLDRLFFTENAVLVKEYRRLFSSLFRNATPYLEIINLLAEHPKGMTREEIAKATKQDNNGKLGDMLTDLVYCDFLAKNNIRERKISTKSAIYQLIDCYTIFYNTFIKKGKNKEHFWTLNLNSTEVNSWMGVAYERVCRAHIPQIKEALGIGSVSTNFYSWRSKVSEPAAQIDIIIDRADNMINLCEVKYSGGTYSLNKDEYMKIVHRCDSFKSETGTNSTIIPTMITTFGMSGGSYSDQITVKLDMNALFR